MGRSSCCDENGLKKGPWTPEEDQKLVHYIHNHGHSNWRNLPKLAGLNRCGKSCRLRWTNYLRPDIKRGKFSVEEEKAILKLHSILGNKWSAIATHLPGRTDNEIKNFWNTHLKKKLIQMGLDPMTHRPRTDIFAALPELLALANLHKLTMQNPPPGQVQDHLAQLQEVKLQYFQCLLQSASAMASSRTTETHCVSTSPTMSNMLLPEHSAGADLHDLVSNSHHGTENAQMVSYFELMSDFQEFSNRAAAGSQNTTSPEATAILPLPSQLPPLSDPSAAYFPAGDAPSFPSTCDGSSSSSPFCWPEMILDDSFMTEFY